MPAERVSMRRVREILRLKHACGASDRAIARALGVARSTVALTLERLAAAGLVWPLPVGAGQLAAMLGTDRTTVDHHVPGRGLGSRAHQPDQGDMDPAQHGRGAPRVQAAAQGGTARTRSGGPQLTPLHTLANEEP